MTDQKSPFVVSADWLQDRLNDASIRILDASWYLPAQGRDPRAEYSAAHIPGAVFYDQDAIADLSSGLPHTIPSPKAFAATIGDLGVSETDMIVVYDGPGMMTAPRVWWLLRTMGAKSVFVLDGGMDGWKAEGRPVNAEIPTPRRARFEPRFEPKAVTSFERMSEIVASGARQIADARANARFTGEQAEPRAGMRSGHMPGARSLPFNLLSSDGKLKSLPELRDIIQAAGIDLDKPVVTSCGSGITAAVITLALQSIGHTDNSLYDGSWAEWGGRPDTAIVTGQV